MTLNWSNLIGWSIKASIAYKMIETFENQKKQKETVRKHEIPKTDALELLIEPIVDYMCNYAGDIAAAESGEEGKPVF
jgi:spermidine/putrescine-binding protein